MNLRGIEAVVRDRLGLDPAALGPAAFPRAVERRMDVRGNTTPEAYLAVLATDSAEVAALAAELVVPESWFFRGGRAQFDRLAELIAVRAARQPVRVLSVPCSTGEEPYSLAIALRERLVPPDSYTIDAVDISESHLSRAAAGQFTAFAFREGGADIRPAYFRQAGDRWELLPHLRAAVRFRTGNAIDPLFLQCEPPYDLILCRNLFIYLTAEAQRQATATLDRLLTPDGWLCLTPAEADRLPPGRFAPEGAAGFGIYRRAGSRAGHSPAARSDPKRPSRPKPLPPVPPPPRFPAPSDLEDSTRPTKAPPSLEVARTLADAGRLAEARAACEELTRGPCELPDAYSLLGVVLQAQGHAAEAAEAFRKALYLAPDHPEALTHMIVICEARGEAAQAAALRRRLARATREETG
jgi:chemotaxis protein methyltransferase WspC